MRGKISDNRVLRQADEAMIAARLRRLEELGFHVWLDGMVIRLRNDANRVTLPSPGTGQGGSDQTS